MILFSSASLLSRVLLLDDFDKFLETHLILGGEIVFLKHLLHLLLFGIMAPPFHRLFPLLYLLSITEIEMVPFPSLSNELNI